MADAPLLSVVVCTRDRTAVLAGCLDSLVDQDAPPDLFEVVVVDNGSPPETARLVARYAGRGPAVRCIREERVGLSHARNAGWREARGRYVGYIDDDGRAPRRWVSVAVGIVREKSPDVFGGPYEACYLESKPSWWKDAYRSCEHADKARPLGGGEYLSGNNVFFLKERIVAAGGFDPWVGMRGGRPGYGEETALIDRIRALQQEAVVLYEPLLRNQHVVHSSRMTFRWLVRAWFAEGRDHWITVEAPSGAPLEPHPVRSLLRLAAMFAVDLLDAIFRRDLVAHPFFLNAVFEVASRRIIAMGGVVAQMQTAGKTKR